MTPMSFFQFTLNDLQEHFVSLGFNPTAASKLFNWHYKQGKSETCTKDLSSLTRDYLLAHFDFSLPVIKTVQTSQDDRTVKFLFELKDKKTVETVLIPSSRKYGVCLSSQVGCAMKCSFCHTGLQGLERHLETHEIVGQFLAVQKWLKEFRSGDAEIATIVFMGQGEPLHNFDAVKNACKIFLSQHGLSLAADKITISTAGYLPGLARWKDEMPGVNIALSLHSTDTQKRNELIPINKAYPLEKVIACIDAIPMHRKRFVVYEYLLAKGFNASAEDAKHLGELLKGKRAFVNLIPFNPFPGARYERPSEDDVMNFKHELDQYGISCLVRFTKGSDILAACGQLSSKVSAV